MLSQGWDLHPAKGLTFALGFTSVSGRSPFLGTLVAAHHLLFLGTTALFFGLQRQNDFLISKALPHRLPSQNLPRTLHGALRI